MLAKLAIRILVALSIVVAIAPAASAEPASTPSGGPASRISSVVTLEHSPVAQTAMAFRNGLSAAQRAALVSLLRRHASALAALGSVRPQSAGPRIGTSSTPSAPNGVPSADQAAALRVFASAAAPIISQLQTDVAAILTASQRAQFGELLRPASSINPTPVPSSTSASSCGTSFLSYAFNSSYYSSYGYLFAFLNYASYGTAYGLLGYLYAVYNVYYAGLGWTTANSGDCSTAQSYYYDAYLYGYYAYYYEYYDFYFGSQSAYAYYAMLYEYYDFIYSYYASIVGVSIANFAFSPNTVTVSVGQPVAFTNYDSATHTSTSSAWDSGNITSGATFTTSISQPGTYSYHCSIHPFMTGTVTVQ
jgi:plastocyanin